MSTPPPPRPRKVHPHCRSERDIANKRTVQHGAINSAQVALLGIIKSLVTPNHEPLFSAPFTFSCLYSSLRKGSGRYQPARERSPCMHCKYRKMIWPCVAEREEKKCEENRRNEPQCALREKAKIDKSAHQTVSSNKTNQKERRTKKDVCKGNGEMVGRGSWERYFCFMEGYSIYLCPNDIYAIHIS